MKRNSVVRMRFAVLYAAGVLMAVGATAQNMNAYVQKNLVANLPEFGPEFLDPDLLNPWGVSLRPPGAGGHIWTSNAASGTTTLYVGDVPGVPLYQDEVQVIGIPSSEIYKRLPETVSQPTGQVFNHSRTDFVVSGEGISGAAKFIFCSLDGSISAWTTDQLDAHNVIDDSAAGSMYTGLAVTERKAGNRIYVCNFGLERLDVFDHNWQPTTVSGDFRDPAVPSVYCHYNIQYLAGRLYVAWARIGDDPGEEDNYQGYGYLSSFDTEGHLLASFQWGLWLNAPWGLAIAPDNFGPLSNTLLAANFGDGTIVAYDLNTLQFIDYVRDARGEPVSIDGIWGLIYGNGETLGRANHLYFTAGPNTETDGIFGKLYWVGECPGDVNGNRRVNVDDLTLLLSRFGTNGIATWADGDVDGDGDVGLLDLSELLAHFGKDCP